MNLWLRWRLAMASFLHCVAESYRKSVAADPQPIYWDSSIDPGSTSTQIIESEE